MSIILISDLHLDPREPQKARILGLIREKMGKNCSELYILGDFFETWIGDDEKNELITETITELQAWRSQGTEIYFMPGNRDFLLGQAFGQKAGFLILPDPYKTEFYGHPVLLSHGDALCIDDTAYQAWRQKVHQPWLQKLFLALPLWLRRFIAQKMRAKSRRYTQTADPLQMDLNTAEVLSWLQKAKVDTLIHGHTHRPGYHLYYQDHQAFTRITLSDWHDRAHGLIWEKDGRHYLWDLE